MPGSATPESPKERDGDLLKVPEVSGAFHTRGWHFMDQEERERELKLQTSRRRVSSDCSSARCCGQFLAPSVLTRVSASLKN